jgi:UPF0716 protein FxsA
MIVRFFILVLFFSFAELYLLIFVASQISVSVTFMLCLLTGVLGGSIVRAQGLNTLREIMRAPEQGRIPGREIISGLILLVMGTLLLTPGFITDTIAFLFLIPPLRSKVADRLARHFAARVKQAGPGSFSYSPPNQTPRRPEDVVIDVEAEEVD